MTKKKFDYTGFYSIVFTEYCDQEILQRVLIDCWSLEISNAIILTPAMQHEKINLYTYFPYTMEHCAAIVPVIYDYFENGNFSLNRPIFPNKFRNFHKCPLMIPTYSFAPYISLTQLPNGIFTVGGIEGRLLYALSEGLNFRPVFQLSRFNFGENQTSTLRKSLEMVNIFLDNEKINHKSSE